MVPGQWSFTVVQGTDVDLLLTWHDADGSPVNLSGFTAEMQIRNYPGGVVYGTLSTGNSQIVLGGTQGTIELLIPASQTSAYTWQTPAYYDLFVTSGVPSTACLLFGRVTAQPAITVI